MLSVVV
jgi:hypothetical protein